MDVELLNQILEELARIRYAVERIADTLEDGDGIECAKVATTPDDDPFLPFREQLERELAACDDIDLHIDSNSLAMEPGIT